MKSTIKNHNKTKVQLANELVTLRKRIAEFEISESQRRQAEDLLKKVETESKHAYEALKASETRYRRLFETAQDGILLLNADSGQITDVNPFLIKMLGYSHKEFLGKKLWEIGLFRNIASPRNAFSELQEKGYIRYDGLPLEKKDGCTIDVEFVSNVYHVNGNKVIQCNIRDITERTQAEERSRKLMEDLKRSNTDLQQFANVIAHDLQAPLSGIALFTKILEKRYKGKFDEKANELIDYIIDGIERTKTLIKDLLEYSRLDSKLDSKKRIFEPVICSVALEEAIFNLRPEIEGNGVELTYDLLPTVKGDASQLISLFQNLIGNAIKFRSKELPKVHISVEQKGDEWIFSVRDNGIGIDPEHFEKIFLIFQRLHTSEEYDGTGIGLAICKKITERHGGRIWIDSEPEKGSTFYFTIPDRG